MTKTKRKLYKIKKMRRQGLNYQERGEKIGEIKAGLFKTVEPQRAIEEPVQEIKEPVMEIKKKSWYLRLWGWILKIIGAIKRI